MMCACVYPVAVSVTFIYFNHIFLDIIVRPDEWYARFW